MNKGELIGAICDRSDGITRKQADEILTEAIAIIVDQVAAGRDVRLVGFGTFDSRQANARIGRNPKTGEPIAIAARRMPRFRPGTDFKSKVRG